MKTVLITGATRGIGRAVAKELAHDHRVLVGGRDPEAAAALAAELGGGVFVADLSDEASVARAAERVGDLDAVVHSAGISAPEDVDLRASLRAVFEVNVIAVMDLTELLLERLRTASGSVVFINSGSGLRAMGDTSGYSASKFALTSYAEGLRQREAGAVRVISIHPGRTDTDMQRDLQARMGRSYHAEEHLGADAVARAVGGALRAPDGAVWETVSIRPR